MLLLTFGGAAAFGQSLSRSVSSNLARTNGSIFVTATFQAGSSALRGFCYSEQIPAGLAISGVSLQMNGTPVSGVQLESGQIGDVYSDCVPTRIILETPPAFSESAPLNAGSTLQISFAVTCPTGGVFKLRPASWEAVDPATDLPVFGTSDDPSARALFVPGTTSLPQGAFWTAVWQHSSGLVSRWIMFGTNKVSGSVLTPSNPGTGWLARAVVDLNQDGEPDLIFEHPKGGLTTWTLDDFKRLNSLTLSPSAVQPVWKLVSACDLLGNSQPALLFQHTNGTPAIWFLNGTNAQSAYLNPTSVATSWRLAAAGTFQLNGPAQLIWQHTDGWLSMWTMNGTNRIAGGFLNPSKVDPHWKVVGAADLDGDGKTEILWRHDSGYLNYWIMDGTNRVSGGPFGPGWIDPAWKLVGAR